MAEAAEALAPVEAVPETKEQIRALLARSKSGDRTALPVVRAMLVDPAHLRRFGGELAETVVRSFTEAMGGADLGFREAVLRKLELMRTELLGENPTPVERLLAERIAACWLAVQDAEIRYAQFQDNLGPKKGDYYQRRMDATNKRFLAAVRTLALVRKLAVPVLQVNIAREQLNVVAPTAG